MDSAPQFLLTLGGILLLGLITSAIGRNTPLPRVTLLLIFGVLIGQQGLNIIPPLFTDSFELIADMALLMVGFLLGGKLTRNSLRHSVGKVLWISLSAALFTTLVVILGLSLLGVPMEVAILLGCLASATDPAAIFDVIGEGKHRGAFKNLLLSVVAIDDAWALLLFGLGVSIVSHLNGDTGAASSLLLASHDIVGAIVLGFALGLPAALLTGRIKSGQPILSEALGLVFICGGLALWLGVSFLIAAMTLGAVIANFARHHDSPFHAIEGVEWPFMLTFFVLAGATLDLSTAASVGFIGAAYILLRAFGKLFGGYIGALGCRADDTTRRWMGLALLPQAGVAIGMALVASGYFPEHRQVLLSVAIGSTVLFEIIGPIFTKLALQKADLAATQKSAEATGES